jgi:hypothetical protein
VKIKYSVDSREGKRATSGLREETKHLGEAAKSTSGEFIKMGAAIVGAFAGHEARKLLIDFNRDVENAKIGLASMVQGNTGGTWDKATEKAGKLYDEFQKFSTLTPVTTQEILEFGKSVAVATFQAGGAIRDLTEVTEQGVIAAKAFGYGSAYSALELSEMLAGNVNKRMMFAKQLLGMAHMEESHFNQLTAEKRLEVVKGVLNSDAMKNAAQAFGESWAGVTSTFEDKAQIAFGKVGLPLFRALTAEVKGWNGWLEQNKRKLEEMAHSVGEGLVTGFRYVKEVVTFLVDHADAITAIGKIWLATKVGGMLAGSAASGGKGALGAFANLRAWMAPERDRFNPETGAYEYMKAGAGRTKVTMSNIGGSLPLLGQAAAIGTAFGTVIDQATGLSHSLATLALDKTSREFDRVTKAADALTASLNRAADAHPDQAPAMTNLIGARDLAAQQANVVRDMLRAQEDLDRGLSSRDARERLVKARQGMESLGIDESDFGRYGGAKGYADAMAARAGQLSGQQAALGIAGMAAWEIGIRQLTDYQSQTLDVAKAQQDLLAYINTSLAHGVAISPKTVMEILRRDTDDPTGQHKKMAEKPNVNVHIARIEVQSDDPDRMAFGLIESFRDAAKNPSSAFATLREG